MVERRRKYVGNNREENGSERVGISERSWGAME